MKRTRMIIFYFLVLCFISLLGLSNWGGQQLSKLENGEYAALFSPQRIAEDLSYFDALGIHRTGSNGDIATTDWLAQQFQSLGFKVRREAIFVDSWKIEQATLLIGDQTVEIFPQFPVTSTPESGVSAPISLWSESSKRDYSGQIVLIETHFSEHRGSLTKKPELYQRILTASESGASAIVVITRAGCGRYQALNAPLDLPNWKIPVVLAGEDDAERLLDAAEQALQVSLRVNAIPERLQAYNLVAEIGSENDPAIVVSTPQSGWFHATAERGTGVAAFLALARWASTQNRHYQFFANSGHERGYAGAHIAMASAPKPESVAFWLHIGANAGALGQGDKVEKKRFLMTNWWLIPKSWSLFRKHTGMLAWPIPLELGLAGGELEDYYQAGYHPSAGNFGGSPWHHCPNDRLQQASIEATRGVALSYAALLADLFPEQ